MNDLEKRIILLIIKSKELGVFNEKFSTALNKIYGIEEKLYPIILNSLKKMYQRKIFSINPSKSIFKSLVSMLYNDFYDLNLRFKINDLDLENKQNNPSNIWLLKSKIGNVNLNNSLDNAIDNYIFWGLNSNQKWIYDQIKKNDYIFIGWQYDADLIKWEYCGIVDKKMSNNYDNDDYKIPDKYWNLSDNYKYRFKFRIYRTIEIKKGYQFYLKNNYYFVKMDEKDWNNIEEINEILPSEIRIKIK